MDTSSIMLAMGQLLHPTYKWLGVYASNELCRLGRIPPGSCVIINTDPIWRRGEHWLGVMIPKHRPNVLLFVDSYGLPVYKLVPAISVWVHKQGRTTLEQCPFAIQRHQSAACGPLTVFILTNLMRYRDNLPNLVQAEFSPTNQHANENKAYLYLLGNRINNTYTGNTTTLK